MYSKCIQSVLEEYSKRKSRLAEKKLYTLLLIEKVSRIQFVYEPKMRWGSRIHIVEEEKTLKVSSYTLCIRVKNASGESYTYCT